VKSIVNSPNGSQNELIEVNLEMIKAGLAFCYKRNKCPGRYREAMQNAKEAKLGVWSLDHPKQPQHSKLKKRKKNSKKHQAGEKTI